MKLEAADIPTNIHGVISQNLAAVVTSDLAFTSYTRYHKLNLCSHSTQIIITPGGNKWLYSYSRNQMLVITVFGMKEIP
jgi:hypothetical protein